MTAVSPRGRGETLDVVTQVLGFVKDACSIKPAQDAFDSTNTLLTMIRVWLPRFSGGKLLTRVFLGRDGQRRRLRPTRALLRRRMHGPRSGIERQTVG